MKKQAQRGLLDPDKNDTFELFVSSTTIRYCFYKDTHKILGTTFGMLVLQDFESITPNVLARTIETVEGGGCILLLLRTMSSLKQLYTMTMDVHARLRTASHQQVTGRFVERFILSLGSCPVCLVADEELNILPISSHIRNIQALPPQVSVTKTAKQEELEQLKHSLQDTDMIGALVRKTKTLDQAKALLVFIEAITEKTLRTTVALTAARGRGKSASLGLAVACAVGMGYSNIFVTSPHPENLKTFFDFVFQGFDALAYKEHQDYELLTSTDEAYAGCVVRINIHHTHRQTIQYIHPSEGSKLGHAELVVVDEAAAIPLPMVKAMFGPHLMFLSSTVNGYEGTGRALSLKLIKGLRDSAAVGGAGARVLKELVLEEPIRYCEGDEVEKWLNRLLCLDSSLALTAKQSSCPHPSTASLYYVNKDALFSFHKASETFLQRMVALFVASHYKNSPNDLLLMSDAPAHHMFVLLGPVNAETGELPEILCALQVCLEGGIDQQAVSEALAASQKTDSGDLIPWVISQQFQDPKFAELKGVRVVRIATHPSYQGMGYGTRALELLVDYYEGRLVDPTLDPAASSSANLDGDRDDIDAAETVPGAQSSLLLEQIKPRKLKRALLSSLAERPPEALDYVGVSFGVTEQLYRFWQRNSFHPLYVRLTANETTGEHTCIMVRQLGEAGVSPWLSHLETDFLRRFAYLVGFELRVFSSDLALRVLQYDPSVARLGKSADGRPFAPFEELVKKQFSSYDRARLEAYSKSVLDYHVVLDLVPPLAILFIHGAFGERISLSWTQARILVGIGLQRKTVDELMVEMDLPANQLLAFFSKTIRRFVKAFRSVEEAEAWTSIVAAEEEEQQHKGESKKKHKKKTKAAAATTPQEEAKKKRVIVTDTLELGDEYKVAMDDGDGQDEAAWSEALKGVGGVIPSSLSVRKKKKHL